MTGSWSGEGCGSLGRLWSVTAIALLASAACSGDGRVEIDGSAARDSARDAPVDRPEPRDRGVQDAGIEASVDGWNPTNRPDCYGHQYACSDGLDNDDDGLVDSRDTECTGPCDNDETSLALLPIPGDDPPLCRLDCYWDGDSAVGNDTCNWTLKCDPKNPGLQAFPGPCPYDEAFVSQGGCPTGQTQACLDFCLPISPNGCDCFGCCEIHTPAGPYPETVFLGSGSLCTAETPQDCAPCTQAADCLNPCGDCELCLGKTLADLPAGCGGAGVAAIACSPNESPCLDSSFCPDGHYCLTGCCRRWSQ